MEKIFSAQESEKLKKLDSITEELEKSIEEQQDWHRNRKEKAVELVRKVKVLKRFKIATKETGEQHISFIPLKLTFLPKDCGLEDMSPKERANQLQTYVTDLISELNKVSSDIKFKKLGCERIEEFAYIKLPCTYIIGWEI